MLGREERRREERQIRGVLALVAFALLAAVAGTRPGTWISKRRG